MLIRGPLLRSLQEPPNDLELYLFHACAPSTLRSLLAGYQAIHYLSIPELLPNKENVPLLLIMYSVTRLGSPLRSIVGRCLVYPSLEPAVTHLWNLPLTWIKHEGFLNLDSPYPQGFKYVSNTYFGPHCT